MKRYYGEIYMPVDPTVYHKIHFHAVVIPIQQNT